MICFVNMNSLLSFSGKLFKVSFYTPEFIRRFEEWKLRPVVKPSNPLKQALPNWTQLTKGLHLSEIEFPLEVINGGYKVDTEGLGPLSPSDFKTFEGDQAFSIFNSFDELLKAGKLLGPFEVDAVDVKGYVAFFLVEKPGRLDEHGRKVYRLIIDASRECLLYGYQKDLILSSLDLKKLQNDEFPDNYL